MNCIKGAYHGMKVSVTIPTLNERATIGKLLNSLLKDPYLDKEIIVIDGGSTDGTVEIARKYGVIVLEEKGKQKSIPNARNQGARASRGEILCFLDGDHDHVKPYFITKAMDHFKNPKVIGVVVDRKVILDTMIVKAQESAKNSPLYKKWGTKLSTASGYTIVNARVPFLRKIVFDELGGFPLTYGEDAIFLQKLNEYLRKNPDKKVVFERNSVIYGRRISTLREYFKKRIWYGRTVLTYLKIADLSTMLNLILLLTQPAYLFSMVSIPLMLISPWFLIPALPYLAKFVFILYDFIRHQDKYRLLTPLLDFVGGVGWTIGLLQYASGRRRLSRGKTH